MSALLQPSLAYRCMAEEDLDAVCAIEQRIYEFPWTRGNFADSRTAGYACTVMERAGEMIGYGILLVAAGESHLLNLSIDAPWQRQGFGRALLLHHIDLARVRGVRVMLLEVRPSNAAARALYAAAGFHQIAVRRGYYPAPVGREDAMLLGLRL
jgi:ribosomal-protein-alanine N-acetyltransferase